PRALSESMTEGNNKALPMVTIFGRKPCCAACDQKVAKSGGIMLPVTISAPTALNAEICEEKSLFMSWYRPGSVSLYPALASAGGSPRCGSPQALPSASLGNRPPTTLLVGAESQSARNASMTSSSPQKKW